MRMAAWTFATVAAGLLGLAPSGRSEDVWEQAGDDTPSATTNILRPGTVQPGHDLSGIPGERDDDWMRVVLKLKHSYEARVSGIYWREDTTLALPTFDLVNADGTVAIAGRIGNEDVDGGEDSIGRTVRFIAGGNIDNLFLRASAAAGVETDRTPYSVSFHDTTLFVPRWNNTASQTTVLVLQNTTNAPVPGIIYFHDAAGVQLAVAPVDVPTHGVQVIPTAAIAALAGRSGSALVAQVGGHGAIAGKAVALEAATGFTFDTPFVHVQR
jgi:hypothetical protein